MKIAVIGSRTFDDAKFLSETLDAHNISLLISGGASGADALAEQYAHQKGVKTHIIKPDYKRFGRGATFVRNKEIVLSSEMLIAFWDGKSKGTQYTIEMARTHNVKVQVKYF
ncbi:MAG: hypothetical protein C0594_15955 [Marinilabiliales bacterium]|nr:MAG: hypothetical protein C0594_15955 [Marinilabiliales bacterium]